MQANRTCSGVPISPEELERREQARQLRRQRAAAAYHQRRHRKSRGQLTVKPKPEINCRLPESDRDDDRQHRIARNQIGLHRKAPDEQNALFASDRTYENRGNSMKGPRVQPAASVEAEFNVVGAAVCSRSPERHCRTCDDVTALRKRSTTFTIEHLLYG